MIGLGLSPRRAEYMTGEKGLKTAIFSMCVHKCHKENENRNHTAVNEHILCFLFSSLYV